MRVITAATIAVTIMAVTFIAMTFVAEVPIAARNDAVTLIAVSAFGCKQSLP